MQAVNIHIFSLVHQLRLLLALDFVRLVSYVFSTVKGLFMERLRIVLAFAFFTIAPLF